MWAFPAGSPGLLTGTAAPPAAIVVPALVVRPKTPLSRSTVTVLPSWWTARATAGPDGVVIVTLSTGASLVATIRVSPSKWALVSVAARAAGALTARASTAMARPLMGPDA